MNGDDGLSAFGVDHGVVAKGVVHGPGGLPRSRKLVWVGSKARKGFEGGRRAGHKVATTEVSVKSIGRGAGLGSEAIGRGAGRIGRALERHPSSTGAVVVGTGAGVGAYQYNKAKNTKPKKKTSKPKTPEAIQ